MIRIQTPFILVLTGFMILGLSGCGSDDPSPSGPGVPADQEVSYADPDPADIMSCEFEYEDGTFHTREVPVDQILLMFEAGVDADAADASLAAMVADLADYDLRVVGRLPRVGIYQLEIDNPSPAPNTAIALLNLVIDLLEAYDGVAHATYNELLEMRFAENDDDNTEITGYDRAAYGMIDYFQAIPVFDEVLSPGALNPVKVAIIDSGIDLDTGQFDDIQSYAGGLDYLDLAAPDNEPRDFHLQKHGTAIAGILAADDGDGIVNGVALRVLGERLSLFVANTHIVGNFYNAARTLAATEIAIQRGARIVNISQGRHDDGATPRWLRRQMAQWERVFTGPGAEDVLFVCAAPNMNFHLDGNDAPSGVDAPNVLTVGGLTSNVWDMIFTQSARGPSVDIAAPATRVGVCCFGYDEFFWERRFLDGNSFAAPMVASIAAIVASIDPALDGAGLADWLTDPNHTYPAPEDVGGVRPVLLKTAGTALLASGASSVADDLMDAFFHLPDDICDPPGHVINRMVGEVSFQLEGPTYANSYAMDADDLVYGALGQNYGLIQPGSFVVNFAAGGDIVNIGIDRDFELGRSYSIPGDGDILMSAGAAEGRYTGFGEGGTLTFSACEITGRSLPLDHFDDGEGIDRFVFIEVQGTFVGGLANGFIDTDPPQDDVTYTTSGAFTTGFLMLAPDAATIEHLETGCTGGYRHGIE